MVKISELIELLSEEDPEVEVRVAVPSGDYWRNMLARDISKVEERYADWNGYYGEDVVRLGDEDEDEDEDESKQDLGMRILLLLTKPAKRTT